MAMSRFARYVQDLTDEAYKTLRQSVQDPVQRPVPLVLATVSGSLGVVVLWRYWRNRKRALPPSPKGWPILGNLLDLSEDSMHKDLIRLQQRDNLPDIFTLNLGPSYRMIVLNTYDVIKEAFVKEGDMFSSRVNGVFGDAIGLKDEIFMKDFNDPTWKEGKAFILSALKSVGFNMAKDVESKLTDQIQEMDEYIKPFIKDGKPIDMKAVTSQAAANVIFDILFSKTYPLNDKELKKTVENIDTFFGILGSAFTLDFFPVWLGYLICQFVYKRKVVKLMESLIQPIRDSIKSHRESLDKDNPRDFLDIYLSKKQGPIDYEILAHTAFILFPDAIDSLTNLLTWIFLYIAMKPEVQARIHKDLDRVTGGGRSVAYYDRADLPYIEAVITEVMRVISIFPLSPTHAASKDAYFRGYFIPKGTPVMANLYAAMHNSNYFKDPLEFNPGRFLHGNGKFRPIEAFIPFGTGRRKCIGETLSKMEIFMFVSRILQKYSIRLPEGIETPPLLPTTLMAIKPHSTFIIEPRT